MAYKQKNYYSITTLSNAMASLEEFLLLVGWTLYDNFVVNLGGTNTAITKKVYRTTGENTDRIPCYICFYILVDPAEFRFESYGFWNATTHTGGNQSGFAASSGMNFTSGGYGITIIGDLDFIYMADVAYLYNVTASAFKRIFFGYLPNIYYNPKAILTENVTAGSNVSISTDNTELPLKKMCIFDTSNGNYEEITISEIGETNITVNTLTKDYTSGSTIAFSPFDFFGLGGGGVYLSGIVPPRFCHKGLESVTGDVAAYSIHSSISVPSTVETGIFQNSFVACNLAATVVFDIASSTVGSTVDLRTIPGAVIAGSWYLQSELFPHLLYCNNTSLLRSNVCILSHFPRKNGIINASTNNSITDTRKTWTTDELKGDCIIIRSGLGIGQVREIISNTATTLTIEDDFKNKPAQNVIYEIVRKAYVKIDAPLYALFSVVNWDGFQNYTWAGGS